jgi:AcrR family transcriptional regulator
MSSSVAGRPVGVHFDGDLRAALLAAAAQALADTDADRLSLRDVARRVGVSHAAPAHHFGDKKGMLTALATEGFERFIEHLAPFLADGQDPVAVLPELGRGYATFARDHPGHFRVMFSPALIHADDLAYVAASDAAFAALRGHIERCQATGWRSNADAGDLAAAAWALAHGVTVLLDQGSLARHSIHATVDGVGVIVATLAARRHD